MLRIVVAPDSYKGSLPADKRNPRLTTTYGTGELLRADGAEPPAGGAALMGLRHIDGFDPRLEQTEISPLTGNG